MLLHGFHQGPLELRTEGDGSRRLSGSFPYNKTAVLSDGGRSGRPRKEVIASKAFEYRVNEPDEDIHLLVGHSYDRPLASKRNGTLQLEDTPDALLFNAFISPEMQEVTWVQDTLRSIDSGLVSGISPGFRLPPKRRVLVAEEITDEGMDPENGAFNAIIRTIFSALLFELSIVTKPAYDEAQVEERNWKPEPKAMMFLSARNRNRWR